MAFKPKSNRTIDGKMFHMRASPTETPPLGQTSSAVALGVGSHYTHHSKHQPPLAASQLVGEHEDEYLFDISAPPLTFYRHIPRIFGSQPPCLSGHTCTLVDDKLYMVGGKTPAGYNTQLYIFNCTTNVLTCPQIYGQVPPPLRDISATYVPGNNHIYFFGGVDDVSCSRAVFVLELDTLTFHRPTVFGRQPEARKGHTSVLRQTRRKNMRRAHSLHLSSSPLSPTEGSAMSLATRRSSFRPLLPKRTHAESNDWSAAARAAVAESSLQQQQSQQQNQQNQQSQENSIDMLAPNFPYSPAEFFLHGGHVPHRPPGPMRSLSQVVDSSDEETDSGPNYKSHDSSATSGLETTATMSSNTYPFTIYIFGGLNDDGQSLSDVWKLHISTNPYECKFSEVISLDKDTPIWPSARAYHTAHDYDGSMLIYGGTDGNTIVYDKLWLFDFVQEKWTVTVPHSSRPRCFHVSAIYWDHLIVIGGHDGENAATSVDVLNMNNWTWHSRMCNGVQSSGQCFHKGTFHDGRFFIVGGLDPVHILAGLRIIEMPNVRL